MTDRVKGLMITLDRDYRTDDAQSIIDAIMMIKGVLQVDGVVVDFSDHMNRARIIADFQEKLFGVLSEWK